jgi:hypothetical protein
VAKGGLFSGIEKIGKAVDKTASNVARTVKPAVGPAGPRGPMGKPVVHDNTVLHVAKYLTSTPKASPAVSRRLKVLMLDPTFGPRLQAEIGRQLSNGGILGDFEKAGGIVKDTAVGTAKLGEILGKPLYNAANDLIHGHRSTAQDMADQHAAIDTAWQMSGVPTLAHPGRHSLFDDVTSAAALFPVGKLGKLAELGKAADEASIATKTAKAEDLAARAETGGVRGAVAGKRAARLERKLAQRGAPRTPEQVARHIQENATITRASGQHGLPIPKLEPGQITDRTGGELGARFRAAMKELPAIRAAQEDLRIPERGRVFARLDKAQKAALKSDKPFESLVAANTTRAGKLSAGLFHGFNEFTPEELNQAVSHMANNTGLIGHSLENATLAIKAAIEDGKPLTLGEQKYLEHAFGREVNPKELAASRTAWQKVIDVLGIPRALMASGDISGTFRQTIGAAAYKPKVWSEGIAPSLRSLIKEGHYQGLEEAVHSDPYFPLYERGGLVLPDLGQHGGEVDYFTQSEAKFISNAAEQLNLRELPIPGVKGKKWATGPGDLVRATDRSYAALLTVTRTHLFKTMLDQAVANGWNIDDHLLKSIGDLTNVLTGRGNLLPGHGVTMNALFFSPKLLYSRLNMLGFGGGGLKSVIPLSWYHSLHPFARAQAMRATGQLVATLATVLGSARLLGATVNMDPRNADFGKIRLGNTRIDIAAGLQQPIRLMAQLATGQVVSSTSGKLEHLSGGFAGRSRLDVVQQFLEGKASPIASIGIDALKGKQFNGQPLDWSLNPFDTNSEITGHLTPLSFQDAVSTGQQTHSALAGVGAGVLSGLGVGVGSYSAQKANDPAKFAAKFKEALTGTDGLLQQMNTVGVQGQARHVYAKALEMHTRLELNKAQARKDSPTGKITDQQSYQVTLDTLHKAGLIDTSHYQGWSAAVSALTPKEARHWEYELWNHLNMPGAPAGAGPGYLLSQLHRAYNDKTGK